MQVLIEAASFSYWHASQHLQKGFLHPRGDGKIPGNGNRHVRASRLPFGLRGFNSALLLCSHQHSSLGSAVRSYARLELTEWEEKRYCTTRPMLFRTEIAEITRRERVTAF